MYTNIEDAKNILGKIYFMGGYGIDRRYDLSLEIYNDMDEKSYDSVSLLFLGKIYFDGLLGEKKEKLGFYYIKKAAEEENVEAQLRLIEAYTCGIGIDISKKDARYWIEKAANNNSDDGKFMLGMLYYYGDSVLEIEQNVKYGLDLIEEAANNGVKEAIEELNKIRNYQIKYNKPDKGKIIDIRNEQNRNWLYE